MKSAILVLLLLVPGGDPVKDGLAYFQAEQYAKAAEAFRKALETEPEDPRLNYNLALSLWHGGDFDAAETAAEKAAAFGGGRFEGLRDALLGNLRLDAAKKASPPDAKLEDLEKALGLAHQARSLCEKGATRLASFREPSEVIRNLERAIRLAKELEDRIRKEKEKEKQKEQQKKDDKDQKQKRDPDKEGETKDPDQDPKKQDQKDNEKKEPQPEQKQDPKEQEKKDPERKPSEDEKEDPEKQDPGASQKEAPGEFDPNQELTPEQRQKLMKQLQEFEKQLQQLRAAQKAQRPRVKKDW